jgi:prophage regulatory protein
MKSTRLVPASPIAQATNPQAITAIDDRFLRDRDLDDITGLSRTTRWRLRRQKLFPAGRMISANCRAWLMSEIRDWMKATAKVD